MAGHEVERMFSWFLTSQGIPVVSCDDSRHDVFAEVGGRALSFEVKYDRLAGKTGNIFVEFHSRGKPSGLGTTQADFQVYYFDESFHMLETDLFVERLIGARPRVVSGGDDLTSRGYLVRKTQFREWCRDADVRRNVSHI